MKLAICILIVLLVSVGAQCLSDRVLGSRLSGRGFEPHWRHYVVSMSKIHLSVLSTGSTQELSSRHNRKVADLNEKNHIKQTNKQTNN